ncbi:ImmA/IrrE family metallo-endopeptidase [Staphylococcus cohnii]|uniref:ImmA/IrrE family metallo-endopeptidase n=1 Tax=Staphylococcus cohnii TaxID=29382 RepID=UPI0005893906|nr:ImmA/IrrE family metallo-endopeptidase [Staphylococcus cohnii]
MNKYENLMVAYDDLLINDSNALPEDYEGFYSDGAVLVDKFLTKTRKLEILSEEIAHHLITYGDIRDQTKMLNRKFELKARRLGSELAISLDGLIDAFHHGAKNLYEMSQYFEVSEKYILNALNHYKMKYGLDVYHNGYVIKFEPLQIFEHYKWE